MAGEDMSGNGRHPGVTEVSSSEGAFGSSSFRSDDTSGGSLFSRSGSPFRTGNPLVALAVPGALEAAGDEAAFDASPWVGKRRVRGRLSFRSGSCTGSTGEAVTERTLRLRLFVFEGVPSTSRARSSAPHARLSSLVSWTGGADG